MVPTAARHKVALLCLCIILIVVVLSISHENHSSPTYSATSHELDIAVVAGIAKAEKDFATTTEARAVVVPHHLVASEAVAIGIRAISVSKPTLILVISPDHYGKCLKLLCTTYGAYKTFFGDTAISDGAVSQLLSYSDIVDQSDLFTNEHGVYSIVPFIKHYDPEALILPIAISQKGRGNEQSRAQAISILGKILKEKDTVLVISSDFSHYLPLAESNSMDEKTQHSFCSGNSEELLNLQNPSQSDCPLCLWILYQEAVMNDFWNPVLVWHSNSADLLHDRTVKETTSHFTFLLGKSSAASCKP